MKSQFYYEEPNDYYCYQPASNDAIDTVSQINEEYFLVFLPRSIPVVQYCHKHVFLERLVGYMDEFELDIVV